ncbi:MAG: hypothetical protein WCP28_02665 [Actinomycetes bacterium]
MSERLDANTTLTAEQKAQRLEFMKNRIDQMVTTPHTPGSGTGMGSGSRMGPGTGAGMMARR